MNELTNENSPYLLQHANNPVHWKSWNNKILEIAKKENKIILVSIGYATCHWCHVMEKESFENETFASYMNQNFINIKIDREERPELDAYFMDVIQMIKGNGGWPLNVFLTPDALPFFGGTYFPPKQRQGLISWPDLLENISKSWLENPEGIIKQANQIYEHNKKDISLKLTIKNDFEIGEFKTFANDILNNADFENGGFGTSPKFPQFQKINYLINDYILTENVAAKTHALNSVFALTNNGIFDCLKGGIFRYSTDTFWKAPHFEKMLYDNALLLDCLVTATYISNEQFISKAIEKTVQFLKDEMLNKSGLYFSAIDADSEGVEGKFYCWSKDEINSALNFIEKPVFTDLFEISEQGNWEHNLNILHPQISLKDLAKKHQNTIENIEEILQNGMAKLLLIRNKRIRPITDTKLQLSWNFMLLNSFINIHKKIDNIFLSEAIFNAENSLIKIYENATFFPHIYTTNISNYKIEKALLEDYAWGIKFYLNLYTISYENKFLTRANDMMNNAILFFSNENDDLFYLSHINAHDVPLRKTDYYDSAYPSSNSVMAENLWLLGIYFNDEYYSQRANNMISKMNDLIQKYPSSFANWCLLMQKMNALFIITINNINDLENIKNTFSQSNLFLFIIDFKLNFIKICKGNICFEKFETVEKALEFLHKFVKHTI